MRRFLWALPLLVVAAIFGCASLMHTQDPSLDDDIGKACATMATEQHAALQAEADKKKLSFDDIKHLFEIACALRMKQGLEPARAAGLSAARHEAPSDAGAP